MAEPVYVNERAEEAFDDWYCNVILPDGEPAHDIAHEAFMQGWDAAVLRADTP